MKTKTLNVKFKKDQRVVCTWGSNKGKEFIIEVVLKDGYSCSMVGGDEVKYEHKKYYAYDDNKLEEVR